MERIRADLREDYQRWRAKLSAAMPAVPDVVTPDDALRAHYLLVDFFAKEGEPIGLHGPRDEANLLVSAIGRQTIGFDGQLKWKEPLECCATLFFGLVKNHPFHDGNKRTALLTLLYSLHKLRRLPTLKQVEYEQLALRTAGSQLHEYRRFRIFDGKPDAEVAFLADFLRRGSRRAENRHHVVTYSQLDTILRKHGFYLGHPSGNYISVMKPVVERHGFLNLRRRAAEKLVTQIGFPRWTAQVTPNAIRTVLRETGLTRANGYDSDAIFRDADSLDALIDEYRDPLRRLKDK